MLADINFTQFLPHDQKKIVAVQRGSEIADKARDITDAGYRLECKSMGDGAVAVAIADPSADQIVSSRVLANGEGVPLAVDAMISEFHAWLTSAKQFTAGFVPQSESAE